MQDTTASLPDASMGNQTPGLRLSDNVLMGLVSGGLAHGLHYGSMAVLGLATGGLAAAVLPVSIVFGAAAYGGWYVLDGHKKSVADRVKAAAMQTGIGVLMYTGASYALPHEINSTPLTRDFVEQAAGEAKISIDEYLRTHVCLSEQGLEDFYTKWDRDALTPGFQ